MQSSNKNRLFGRIKTTAAVMLIAVIATLSLGCSFVSDFFARDSIAFTRHNLTLFEGEVFNLSEIIETNETTYKLSSSDAAVATVDDSTLVLTAVGAGTAYITAQTNNASDKLKVVVNAKDNDSVTLSSSGELVQTFGKTSVVSFSVQASGAPDKIDSVYWYVNDKLVKLLDRNASFEYMPIDVGEFTVTAKCGEFVSDGVTVRVFNPVSVAVSVAGELQQDGTFTDIVFSVTVTDEQEYHYFQYYEDEKALYEGDARKYTYKPTPGRHTLSVKVNGQVEYSSEACFVGAIVPTVKSGLTFDNMYPHAYLRYDAVGSVTVEIMRPVGGAQEYSQSDNKYADLFDDNGFDVGGLIDICATGDITRLYRFRVKSMGDGDVITESGYSDYVTFTQLPAAAEKYVKTVLPCGDLYVTSESEYVQIVEYYVFFREKQANTDVKFDCYIGYDRAGSAEDLWKEAFPIAATSGVYKNIKVTDGDAGVMHTEFTVDSINNPTTQTAIGSPRATQLHAVLPHINYDSNKYRSTDYTFAIDKISRTAEVTYSDELYLAAQSGVRPLPKTSSPASTIYQKARAILRMICTDDMTDVQKAHAIYDWIMWQVTYDTPATKITKGGEAYGAYYLEGVFGDGSTKIGGVAYNANAVCDGMSKAYVLMCNIEGIPCVRVVGKAGKTFRNAGGHAWNKVFVNGAWYLVDCTWGDTHVTLALDGASREYEIGVHSHLFLTDAQVDGTHFEPYRYGDTTIRYAPQTSLSPINVYESMTVNGVSINCYIASNENESNRIRDISTAFAGTYKNYSTITVPGGADGGIYSIDYQAIEIYAESGFTLNDNAVASTVTAAIKAVHSNATVKVLSLDNAILVLMKA